MVHVGVGITLCINIRLHLHNRFNWTSIRVINDLIVNISWSMSANSTWCVWYSSQNMAPWLTMIWIASGQCKVYINAIACKALSITPWRYWRRIQLLRIRWLNPVCRIFPMAPYWFYLVWLYTLICFII